jgi:hypothetical protein
MIKLRIFVLTILLSCQLSALVAPEQLTVASNKVQQSLSFDQTIDHQHDDVFAFHLDQSSSSPMLDGNSHCCEYCAMATHLETLAIHLAQNTLFIFTPQEEPLVVLEGLLRPPQLFA